GTSRSFIIYAPEEGNFMPVYSSHSLIEAGTTIDFSATFITCAPIFICVLIQGSKGVPSSLSQVIYSSIGISGYIPFSDGRTGATIFLKLLLTANSFIFLTIRLLKPLPLNSDRKSTRLNSSHVSISYAVFCLI